MADNPWGDFDAQVTEYYRIYLGRDPSPEELRDQEAAGLNNLAAVLRSIKTSDEHRSRFQGQVAAWYRDLLGRAPTAEELNQHWNNGDAEIQQVLTTIKNSPDAIAYRNRTPPPSGTTPPPGGTTPPPGGGTGQRPTTMGGWQQWFQGLTNGVPFTPAGLVSLESKLGEMGVKVLRNAEGVAGKIQLPDGTIVDVIQAAGLGGKAWTWDAGTGEGTGGGGGTGGGTVYDPKTFGKLQQPFGETFSYEPWQGTQPFNWDVPPPEKLVLPDMPALPEYNNPNGAFTFDREEPAPFSFADFVPPTEADMLQDPSYKVRLKEGRDQVDASAAARGSLMTGGTLKALTQYGQDQASKEYAAIYGRGANTWGMNQGNALNEYGSAMDQYKNAFAQEAAKWGMNTEDYMRLYNSQRSNVIDPYAASVAKTTAEWTAAKGQDDTAYNRAFDTYKTNTGNAKDDWSTDRKSVV